MLAMLSQLHRQTIEFTAFCLPDSPLEKRLTALEIPCHPVRFHDSQGQRFTRQAVGAQLVPVLQAGTFDLLHANSLSMARLTGALSEQLPVPCTGHLRDIIKLSKAAIRDLNRNRRLFAVSQATRNFHIDQGLDPKTVAICYNGVDVERFQPRPATGALKKELGLTEETQLCLTIGQIGLRKGQDVLAQAAELLAGQGAQQTHFVIVGERHSQKQESIDFDHGLDAAFSQPKLAGRLHRLGYRDDIPFLMNEVDLLVHPAKQEPLGRVLLEAIASGLPLIATDVGGTGEIVQHDESALLVPPQDAQSLARSIQRLLDDPLLAQRLAQAARERALERFTSKQASRNMESNWLELCP